MHLVAVLVEHLHLQHEPARRVARRGRPEVNARHVADLLSEQPHLGALQDSTRFSDHGVHADRVAVQRADARELHRRHGDDDDRGDCDESAADV